MNNTSKVASTNMSFGVALTLSNFLPRFNSPTAYHEKVIDQLLEMLEILKSYQLDQVKVVFQQFGIPQGEEISYNHPQYNEVAQAILTAQSPGERKDFQLFSTEQFEGLVEGLQISYSDRKLLKYWLLKEAQS